MSSWVVTLPPRRLACTVLPPGAPISFVITNTGTIAANVPTPVASVAASETLGASIAAAVPVPTASLVAVETVGASIGATPPNPSAALSASETISALLASAAPQAVAALAATVTIGASIVAAGPNAVAALAASETIAGSIVAAGPNAVASLVASAELPKPSLTTPLGSFRADVATAGATFTWVDSAGGFGNATQSTGAKQPSINASSANFNSKPSLSFNGTSAFLTTATSQSARGQPWTMYAVVRWTNSGSVCLFDPSNQAPHLLIGNTASNWYMYNGASVSSSNTSTSPLVICAVFNGNSSASALYINSSTTAVATGDATHPGTSGTTGGVWTFGAIGGGASQWYGGEITDLDFYGAAHSQTDRGKYFAYVASRYGIAAS